MLIVTSAASAIVATWVALVASRHDRLAWDRPVLLWIHHHSVGALDVVLPDATWLGSISVLAPIAAVLIVVMLVRRQWRWREAGFLVASLGGAFALNWAIRLMIDRPRPGLWAATSPTPGSSFPSGHSLDSLALAIALTLLAWGTRGRLATAAVCLLAALVVAYSRLYTGAHWPSDVLGGWAIAVVWVAGVAAVALPQRGSR